MASTILRREMSQYSIGYANITSDNEKLYRFKILLNLIIFIIINMIK